MSVSRENHEAIRDTGLGNQDQKDDIGMVSVDSGISYFWMCEQVFIACIVIFTTCKIFPIFMFDEFIVNTKNKEIPKSKFSIYSGIHLINNVNFMNL